MRAVALAALAAFLWSGSALAQASCAQLAAQIEAAGRGGAARYEQAAMRQRAELDRTVAYGQQLGCGGGLFAFGRQSSQCSAVDSRIRAIAANLRQLEAQASQAGGGARAMQRRAALQQQYDASCVARRGRDLFGDWGAPGTLRSIPVDPREEAGADTAPSQQEAQAGGYAVCVRTCDGGYFPLGLTPRRDKIDVMDDLCQALCPNTQARLYTFAPGGGIGTAVNIDGAAYSELKSAFRYRQSFDRACTCKPPGQDWAKALARAEEILNEGFRGGDADPAVTEQQSERMARPRPESLRPPLR